MLPASSLLLARVKVHRAVLLLYVEYVTSEKYLASLPTVERLAPPEQEQPTDHRCCQALKLAEKLIDVSR